MKRVMREDFVRRIDLDGPAHEERFLSRWFSADVRPQLDAAALKLVPRG